MRALVCALFLASGCDSGPKLEDPDEIPLVVAQTCPGGPGCEDTGDGKLYAAVAKRELVAKLEAFDDVNMNNLWDEGESFTDLNGNGKWDGHWIAGNDSGRLALKVHDPIWARAIVLRFNQTTVAFVSCDLLGLFYDELKQVRERLDPALGIDLVVSSATHVHEAPDTVGGWGKDAFENGTNPDFQESVRRAMVEAISEAAGRLVPATLTAGSIAVADGADTTRYVSDTRDPTVIDNRMHVLRFDGLDGKPVGVLINWAAHPESAGSKGHEISSDFVNWLRQDVEAALGAQAVYISGALGGQIGAGEVQPIDPLTGAPFEKRKHSFAFSEAWGHSLARFALRALDPAQGGDVIKDAAPRLSFKSTRFNVHVDNTRYLVAGMIGVFNRTYFGYDKKKPLRGDNAPLIDTEMAYFRLGDKISIITFGGELLPELFLGGYGGEFAYNWSFIDAAQVNAPNPALAPPPPYLRDRMEGELNHRMVFGLSFDFLGYIIPRYNFTVDPIAPYIREAEGDHYEETNSLGHRADPEMVGTARQLIMHGREVTP